ncbi:MAG TPA: hypothetical protein VJT69_01340 [Pyrinomonadaceae bacterium]|nr:hypothetical protein [Pyrinomonadaceae bacterium]
MTFVPFLWLIAVEDEGKRVAACGPTTIGISYRQINLGSLLVFPDSARNLFAVQQEVLHAGEDAAPVTTVDRLINDAANLYINSIATKNPVVNTTEQIQQPAMFPHRGITITLMVVSPNFRFVLPHGG